MRAPTLVSIALSAACSTPKAPPPKTADDPTIAAPPSPKPADAAPPKPPPTSTVTVVSPPNSAPPANDDAISRKNREALTREFESHLEALRPCFEDAHGRGVDMNGAVSTRFVVAPSGDVVSISDENSQIRDEGLIRCVEAAIGQIKFTPFEGKAITLVHPVAYQIHGDDAGAALPSGVSHAGSR